MIIPKHTQDLNLGNAKAPEQKWYESMDRVDILIATYNGEKWLDDLLQSIFLQSYQNFKLIFRDDASSDSTLKILKKYRDKYLGKILILPSNKNVGVIENFSRLAMASTADYVMFCDQDDVWKKDKIKTTLQQMHKVESNLGSEHPILIHTDLSVVDAQLNEIAPSFWNFANQLPNRFLELKKLLFKNGITGCTVMLNRKLVDLSSPIPKEAVMHDWWFSLVASAFGTIDYIDKALILYRQHPNNQIGAYPASSWKRVKRGLQFLLGKKGPKYYQAQVFLDLFYKKLTDDQRKTVKNYLSLQNGSFFKRASYLYTQATMGKVEVNPNSVTHVTQK